MRLAAVVLLAIACAGCVGHGQVAPRATPAALAQAPTPAQVVLAPATVPASGAPPILASLSLADLWLKPMDAQTATVAAPAGTTISWFASIRGVTSHLLLWSGGPYVVADHGRRVPTHPATGDVAPGAATVVRFPEAGRYSFASRHAPGASLTVTARPEAPPDARVFLVGGSGAVRFLPESVEVRPGGAVTFVNEAQETGDATGTAFLLLIPGSGPTMRFSGVDEGVYDVLAVVSGASGASGAPAELRARFLVDFDRPDPEQRLGPHAGTFAQPPAGGVGPSMAIPFNATYPLRSVVLAYQATSAAPIPASVHVTLLREGERVADATSAAGAELRVADLPAGRYRVLVEAERGALVDWTVTADLSYRLPVPAKLGDAP